jgi:hypothetical protein
MRRAEGGAKIFGVFRVKNHDFTPKNHIFANFRGVRSPPPPPPPRWNRPWFVLTDPSRRDLVYLACSIRRGCVLIYAQYTYKYNEIRSSLLPNYWVRVMVFNATFNNVSVKLYCGIQFYWWRTPKYQEKTTDLSQVSDKIFYIILYRFIHFA